MGLRLTALFCCVAVESELPWCGLSGDDDVVTTDRLCGFDRISKSELPVAGCGVAASLHHLFPGD